MTPQDQNYLTVPNYATMPVGRSHKARVSLEDFIAVSSWRWGARFCKDTGTYYAARYLMVDGKRTFTFMHRFILGLKYRDGKIVDHINGDTLDNRRSNLRIVTAAQNTFNSKVEKESLSGLKGVIPRYKRGKRLSTYRAYIYKDYKKIDLGSWPSLELAIAARTGAEMAIFGDHRRRRR